MKEIPPRVAAVFLVSLLALVTAAWHFTAESRRPRRSSPAVALNSTQAVLCKNNIDIQLNIERLASDEPEAKQARERLLALGKGSPECRTETISQLLRAMDKPNLSFVMDRPSYFLWLNGAVILGNLKAVESLDLLIEHLDLNDGFFSASMVHQPAVLGIEKMGGLAVPKLRNALENHPKREIRLATALCLADIGGSEAQAALKDALNTETDQCVRRFITLSLPNPTEVRSNPRHSTNEGEILRQRLLAFRCGN
ncbi:MAG TPA: HEAT repeat domain-containing protein [Pyrinomonadaceae bacterium]|nr:HEAT repeat domain-containing protein [Pyrinomonadaceae bacterium]